MGTHRDGQPGDQPAEGDSKEERPLGSALRDANRTHVTLANLADLNLAAFANKTETESAEGTAEGGAGGRDLVEDASWLAQLPTPTEAPRRRGAHEDDERGPTDDAGGGANGTGNGVGTDHVAAPGPASPVIAPDAVAQPTSTAVVVPGRAKLPGAYGVTTGEHRAWVVPSTLRPPEGEAEADELPVRIGWARLLERWLLEVTALAVASIAFVVPVPWLGLVAVLTLVGAIVAFVRSGRSLAQLPTHAGRRAITLLRPRSLVWVPVFAARTVLGAVLLPALAVATAWYIAHGMPGTVVAARLGAWSYGLRVAAVLLCLMLLTSVGEGRQQRATAMRRWAAPATDGTLAILAGSCLLVVALAVVGAPRPADTVAARDDGLGWLPPGVRVSADGVRDDIVTAELDSLASCLSKRGGTVWKPFYTVENPLDEPDVARLLAAREPSFSPPGDLVSVLLAAHNQLAPWVEAIEVEWPGGEVVRTERATLPRHEPLLEIDQLVPATTSGAQWVSSGSPDKQLVLRCSAAPVL
jgi:hypothetical protein